MRCTFTCPISMDVTHAADRRNEITFPQVARSQMLVSYVLVKTRVMASSCGTVAGWILRIAV